MDTWIISLSALGVTILNIVISRSVAIGSFKAQHKRLSADINKLEEEVKNIMPNVRGYLFKPQGGRPVYVTVEDCEKQQSNCRNIVCDRVEKLEITMKDYMKNIDQKRTEERIELDKILKEIFEFIGEVRNHIKH